MGLASPSHTAGLPTLAKAAQQHRLLGPTLSRQAVMAYQADWPLRRIGVHVVRNVAFESVAAATPPFLAHADLTVAWGWSDYDDSLSLAGFDAAADVVLVWLDFDRYTGDPAGLTAFLGDRLAALRGRTAAPLLLADAPEDGAKAEAINTALQQAVRSLPGAVLYPRSDVARRFGTAFRDPRIARLAGSDLSAAAGLEIARDLGMSWLPALVTAPLKALALDLDNTLYAGVLGEDGAPGVVLTDAHRALQTGLVALQRSGLLLGIVSKNEPQDVEALFAARPDFPLRPEMISAWAVGWGPKAAGLVDMAERLNIGLEAIALVDDNLGEIAQVAGAAPAVAAIHAADPQETLRALSLFPRLRALHTGREDTLRAGDIAMNAERQRLTGSGGDYVALLRPLLRFRRADRAQLGRLQELSLKTNQFNLSLARLNPAQAARYLDEPGCGAAGASLSDALSDSGVVLSMFARREGEALQVDDLCISCRALGRGLEDAMVLEAAVGLAERLGAGRLRFRHVAGPRNQPAAAWLASVSGRPVDADPVYEVSVDDAKARLASLAVTRLWEDEG